VIIRRARIPEDLVPPAPPWPYDLAAVQSLVGEGWSFDAPVTFLVGENGSGKSTVIEGLADAYGADVRGGHIGRKYATTDDKGPLSRALQLDLAPGADATRPKGFFLRAETAYGVFDFMSGAGAPGYGGHLLDVSHSESFLQVFESRFNRAELYLLDEPEAAPSFRSCLALVGLLHDLGRSGAQVVCATHSPLLASVPGATILQLDAAGVRRVSWDELDLVADWRDFLAHPPRYLRHLVDPA
jgi:predicted ATPase